MSVATALTVYGIETEIRNLLTMSCYSVATALTVYGIETQDFLFCSLLFCVATALTVYGIETLQYSYLLHRSLHMLQQLLPFTVLKPQVITCHIKNLEQVATALTVYGIETMS